MDHTEMSACCSTSKNLSIHFCFLLSICGLLIIGGCHSSSAPETAPVLPSFTVLEGNASGTAGNLNIQCRFSFHLEIAESNNNRMEVRTSWSGEAERFVVNGTGEGVGFNGLAAGDFKVTFPKDNRIMLWDERFDTSNVMQFWEEFVLFKGNRLQDQKWSGNWECLPFHTRGDSTGTITGTWTLMEE